MTNYLKMAVDAMPDNDVVGPRVILGPVALERLCKAVRNKALEDVAKTLRNVDALHAAGLVDVTIDAIRNLKEPTPFTAKELLLMNEQHIHASQQTKALKEQTP